VTIAEDSDGTKVWFLEPSGRNTHQQEVAGAIFAGGPNFPFAEISPGADPSVDRSAFNHLPIRPLLPAGLNSIVSDTSRSLASGRDLSRLRCSEHSLTPGRCSEHSAEVSAADLCDILFGKSLLQKFFNDGGKESTGHSLPCPIQAGACS